jgi:hypothetical protein
MQGRGACTWMSVGGAGAGAAAVNMPSTSMSESMMLSSCAGSSPVGPCGAASGVSGAEDLTCIYLYLYLSISTYIHIYIYPAGPLPPPPPSSVSYLPPLIGPLPPLASAETLSSTLCNGCGSSPQRRQRRRIINILRNRWEGCCKGPMRGGVREGCRALQVPGKGSGAACWERVGDETPSPDRAAPAGACRAE